MNDAVKCIYKDYLKGKLKNLGVKYSDGSIMGKGYIVKGMGNDGDIFYFFKVA